MKQDLRKWLWLLPIGLLIISGRILLNKYASITDFSNGLLFGVGVGLIALLFVHKKMKQKAK